jgi:hypothetical protein
MREICASGSVGGEGGNILAYPAVGLNLNACTRVKMGRLVRRRGYTITALVEGLVERAEGRVTARLPSRCAQGLSGRRITRRQQCGYIMTTKDGTQRT